MSLAKVLHPDTVTDPEKRRELEASIDALEKRLEGARAHHPFYPPPGAGYEQPRRMTPTLAHVPLVWEILLGTVSARNPVTGEVRYFDYDYDAAQRFAGIGTEVEDLRIAKMTAGRQYQGSPRACKLVLWGKPIKKK